MRSSGQSSAPYEPLERILYFARHAGLMYSNRKSRPARQVPFHLRHTGMLYLSCSASATMMPSGPRM